MNVSDMQEGSTYSIEFPNGESVVVILNEIQRYKTLSGADYIFEWVSGYDGLCSKYHDTNHANENEFALPSQLLKYAEISEV